MRDVPLLETHRALGAKLVDFAGWLMPLSYSSIIEEHLQVRRHAGLFDVSHMGELLLTGPDAVETVRHLVSGDVSALPVGGAKYTLLLTPQGGIRDDLIAYRRKDGFLLVVNAANAEADREWIEANLLGATELKDLTSTTALLALQGPEAASALGRLTTLDLGALPTFTFAEAEVAGRATTIMRTGYTGEDGFELLVANQDALNLWEALLSGDGPERILPAGLAARDTLRLEAALMLHGQDMTANTSPYEARLGWVVDLDRADFVGQEALRDAKAAGPQKLLVGLATDQHVIPRTHDLILMDDEQVGEVTSGSYSPVLQHPIALGYVKPELAEVGREFDVRVRNRAVRARVVPRPFYRRGVTPVPAEPRRDS